MIQLNQLPLDEGPATILQGWQRDIDGIRSYSDRVALAKSTFSARNKANNVTFTHVKTVLTSMCQGARRCAYCEDSVADEVEHIQPKDLYPEFVFSWANYLYACGPCNGPKNSGFAVLRGRPLQLVDVTRARGAPVVPPLAGDSALINPRIEDPLHFLFLDLLNTFAFTPRETEEVSETDRIRAGYTIRVLRLNARDYLVDARRTAFGNYRARLREYIEEKREGATQAQLDRRRDELLKVGHRTVWREMQRQQANYPPLATLFADSPEALDW